jgi:two-component system, NtrC family, response regulator HydG
MAELVFFRRGEELMRFSLERERTVVGRGERCDVAIPEGEVAKQQFSVERRGDYFYIVDLSGNGTSVGGSMVKDAKLQDGADIALGPWRAIFKLASGGYSSIATRRDGGSTDVMARDQGEPIPVRLRIRTGGKDRSMTYRLNEITIGKDPDSHVVLDDRFASSHHFRLTRRGNVFHLKDLGSTNGTFVNGSRVLEGEIAIGAVIRVGESEMVIEPQPKQGEAPNFEGMVGDDPGLGRVRDVIERVAPSTAAVLIFGETGTGKELVARAIHNRSPRAQGPFIPINCAAISKEIIESELFGHEKGAFTGATAQRRGAFEEANEGTLFLDEIGELPLDLQAKLLRALELGEIRRVGSSKPMRVDVRVVAATNRDLMGDTREGRFREDLYYRLCVIPVQIPPLRQRKGDLITIAEHFIRVFSPTDATVTLSSGARNRLASHRWPGNIRELKNVIHRALLLRRGPSIEAEDIAFEEVGLFSGASKPGGGGEDVVYLPGKAMKDIEREVLEKALRRNKGNREATAEELKVARSTVFARIKEYEIDVPSGVMGSRQTPDDES